MPPRSVTRDPVDRDAVRSELDATRRAYHRLLAALSDEDWTRKSGNPDLTVKELMWHMAWALSWLSRSVDAVRRGRGFNPPAILVEPGRKLAMRWLARRATPDAAARRYDEGHAALLAKLEAVRDDEWSLSATRFGETRSVEWYFRQPARHFEEHAADVSRVLGGAQGEEAHDRG